MLYNARNVQKKRRFRLLSQCFHLFLYQPKVRNYVDRTRKREKRTVERDE